MRGSSIRFFRAVFIATLALTTLAGAVSADKPPEIPAWYNGEIVFFTVVNDNVNGRNRPAETVPIPLYAFGLPGDQPQFDVLSAVPGDADSNPWWKVVFVEVLDGRDVSEDPFTSEAELLEAAEDGTVLLILSDFVFLCQVLPGANR